MNAKERLVLFSVLLIGLLLLPLTLKASTEDELVAKHLAKLDREQPHRLFAPFLSISRGSIDPSGYNYFVTTTNTFVRPVDPQGGSALSKIRGLTSLEGGFGLGVDRGLLTLGFNYSLTMGSANKGDYELYFDLETGLHQDVEDFTFRSNIKVWGVFLDYQYFFYNPPVAFAKPHGLSVRAGGGLGYYGGYWYLWEGFGGIRTDTGEFYELPYDDHLKGSGMGFHLAAGVEYPFWSGFLLALETKYVWLKFDKMKKSISTTYDLYLVEQPSGDPIGLDLTGPRVNLAIKHYFTL